jgi:hypothetical protein
MDERLTELVARWIHTAAPNARRAQLFFDSRRKQQR